MNWNQSASELIKLMKLEGTRLAEPVPLDGMSDMTFDCTFADFGEDASVISEAIPACPPDLLDFWTIASSARLFEDKTYGQWGLEILDLRSAVSASKSLHDQRPKEYFLGDLVVGRFLGDSDLLMIRCDPSSSDFGSVLVALPIDPRKEWYKVAGSMNAFLNLFVKAGGEKFWVRS